MNTRKISIGRKSAQGIEIPLANAVLVLVVARKGFLMCGYLDKKMAEKLGDRAAIISGVKSVDEMLAGPVAELTAAAQRAGIRKGMPGILALAKLL